jgi:type II secretory pathway pseudopilin PulG
MPKLLVATLIALVIIAVLCPAAYSQQPEDTQGVLIDQLLKQVQSALARAQTDLRHENIPPLQSVTLDLTAEVKKEVGGTINLFIVTFGHKWEKSRSQEIEVTLKPPAPSQLISKGPSVSDELVKAIESAARGVQAARANGQVPLVASGLKVVLSFVVTGDTSVGAKFQIVPVTVDLSGDLANSAIQKITVVYQNPEPKK